MKILHTTPAEDGFHMPAEFAPHEGCLMIWPERGDSWQYGAYAARKAFLRVIETISESESMTVLCSEGQYDNARAQLPDFCHQRQRRTPRHRPGLQHMGRRSGRPVSLVGERQPRGTQVLQPAWQ